VQNIVSFIGLFCKRDLWLERMICIHEQIISAHRHLHMYAQRHLHSSTFAHSHTQETSSQRHHHLSTFEEYRLFYRALLQKRPTTVTNDMYTWTDHICTKTSSLEHICTFTHTRDVFPKATEADALLERISNKNVMKHICGLFMFTRAHLRILTHERLFLERPRTRGRHVGTNHMYSRTDHICLKTCRPWEVGGWGRVPFSRNLMSPTPRRKWYLTTGRRFH